MQKKRKLGRNLLSFLLTLAMIVGLLPGMSLTALAEDPYAGIKNTTTEITFDSKLWYLIDCDESTVTLLSKECIGSSAYNNSGYVEYASSVAKTVVDNWYSRNISADAQTAVNGGEMFLLTLDQANNITNKDVLKCSNAGGESTNFWWLCSPGQYGGGAGTRVNGDTGEVERIWQHVYMAFGIRPALKLDLSKVAFDSNTKTFSIGTSKSPATVTTAPQAKTLTYTGATQKLVTAGTATGGEMQYALGTAAEATQSYTTSIPSKTDAGTYYVWYKVVGDENHTDTEPVMLKVTIENADQGETKIETKVKTDEKSPKLETSDLTKEVAESTLTDKEKEDIEEAVNNGKDVNVDVYLAIHDISDEITAEDKAKLEAEASDAGQLAYFDISLFKEIIVDGTSLGATAISELQKPLKLTIGVPNSFPAVETGYTRAYTVLRLHEGEVTTLPATVNADGTISFETDRFSVYALVYKDTKEATTTEATTATTAAASTSDATTAATTEATTATTAAASTSDATTATATEAAKTSPKTGDSMPIAVMVVLMFAAAGMLVFMDLKKKKN